MLGKQPRNTDQVQCVSTETLVPPQHVLRRLHAALDLSFVREHVAPFYSEIGRPSIDPEVAARSGSCSITTASPRGRCATKSPCTPAFAGSVGSPFRIPFPISPPW